jgi:hypothetical protein
MELASRHLSGIQNFEVAPRFLENMCTPGWKNFLTSVQNSAGTGDVHS